MIKEEETTPQQEEIDFQEWCGTVELVCYVFTIENKPQSIQDQIKFIKSINDKFSYNDIQEIITRKNDFRKNYYNKQHDYKEK